jgi:hypothetical protein
VTSRRQRHRSPPVHPSRLVRWTLIFGLLAGCSGSDLRFLDQHPIADSVGFDRTVERTLRATDPAGVAGNHTDRFLNRVRLASVGVHGYDQDDPDSKVFGHISDVAIVEGDRVAVLDQFAKRVEVFGLDGGSLGGFGGPGQGPGELDTPIALLVPDPGEIQVLDAIGRVHRFVENGLGEWIFEERIDLVGFPRDACADPLQGLTVLHVPAVAPGDADVIAKGVLRVHDRQGSHVRSFGVPYRHGQRLVGDRMRRGKVACTGSANVVLALEGSNRVAAWSLIDGSEVWNARLEGVDIPTLHEVALPDGRPGVGQELQDSPHFHLLSTAEPMDQDRVLLQYQRYRWDEALEGPVFEALESWIVGASTGEGGYIGEDLPRVVAIRDSVVVILHVDPFPRIDIATW